MKVVENEKLYASIDANLCGMIDVYVDGSYSADINFPDLSRHPFGAGWAIPDRDGMLAGYGVTAIWAGFTRSSDLSELRAILSFLDLVNEHYPHLNSRENVFRIHSDNQNLVSLMHQYLSVHELTPAMRERYGDEYDRILEYRKKMNLSFHWVKGHDTNEYNNIADLLARRCFRQMLSRKPFTGDARLNYIKDILIHKKMTHQHRQAKAIADSLPVAEPVPSASGEDVITPEEEQRRQAIRDAKKLEKLKWLNGPKLFFSCTTKETPHRTLTVTSYESKFLYNHVQGSELRSTSEREIQLKGLFSAIMAYKSSPDCDPDSYLTVFSSARKANSIANIAVKGGDLIFGADEKSIEQLFFAIRRQLAGMTVRFLDSLSEEVDALNEVALLAMQDLVLKHAK